MKFLSSFRTTQVNQQKIVEGTTVCAYVASTMSGLFVRDILGVRLIFGTIEMKLISALHNSRRGRFHYNIISLQDERFTDGIGIEGTVRKSFL